MLYKHSDYSVNKELCQLYLYFCRRPLYKVDGFVVAWHLGVFLVAKISVIVKDADAGTNLKILLNMKIAIREILLTTEMNNILMELCSYAVIVDALFGTGLSGDV